MNASNDMADRKQMLQDALMAQRKMLIDATGKRGEDIPQAFTPYKEVLDVYDEDWNCRMMLRLYGRTTTMAI